LPFAGSAVASIFEPPPPEPPEPPKRDQVYDAINVILGAWGLYALLAQWIKRRR